MTMICGDDDPRLWTASDSLLAALPDANRIVLKGAGHAPWAERLADTRHLIIDALLAAHPVGWRYAAALAPNNRRASRRRLSGF